MDNYHALPPMFRRGPDAVNDDPYDCSFKISCPRTDGAISGPRLGAGVRTACVPQADDLAGMRVPIEELFLPGGDSSGRR